VNDTDQPVALKKPAHPISGWLAVIPIPAGGEEPNMPEIERETLSIGPFTVNSMKVDMRRMADAQPGIVAAVVVEVGPRPSGWDDVMIPFEENSTVYFMEGVGLKIGEYMFLQVQSVIAWEDAP
jgi:hypothetical protein